MDRILPPAGRSGSVEIDQRLEVARGLIERSGLMQSSGSARAAVLASGAPAATCADVLAELGAGDAVALIQLAALHPLPEEWLL